LTKGRRYFRLSNDYGPFVEKSGTASSACCKLPRFEWEATVTSAKRGLDFVVVLGNPAAMNSI
jgi:hypothetical protein